MMKFHYKAREYFSRAKPLKDPSKSLTLTIRIGYQFMQIAEKYGRKKALITMAVPQMAGWILIYFATNPMYLIASRFLNGFAGGGE
jgi:MFS family permease